MMRRVVAYFREMPVADKAVAFSAAGMLAGMSLSWPLWDTTERAFFPLLPLGGDAQEPAADNTGFIRALGLVVLLAFTAIMPRNKLLLLLTLAGIAGCCVLDLNCLQPWVWFYSLVCLAAVFDKRAGDALSRDWLRWLLAGVYCWSGFSKITPYFAESNFAWLCEAFPFTRPLGQYSALGYVVAVLEMGLSAGLLWPKTRLLAKWLATAMHLLIVACLIRLDWNPVVIPWNLAIIALVWLATADRAPVGKPHLASALIIGLSCIAPALHRFHLWPEALSWSLYSNTQPEATYYAIQPNYTYREPDDLWSKHAFDNRSKMLLDDWANDELRVPMFVSDRTFRQTGRYLCRHIHSDSSGLIILSVNPWNRADERIEQIPCGE